MFYLVAATECLAVVFLVVSFASFLCLPGSRLILSATRQSHPGTAANLLFAVRLLPASLAAVLALIFALPAFILFEPRPSNDYIGPLQLAMASAGGLVLGGMILRVVRALRANALVEKYWKARSHRIQIPGIDAPAYSITSIPSLFVVTGILRPSVFVGREIIENFSASEMAAAAAHEMAHIRAYDNLKQLLLQISRPPAWLMRLGISDEAWMDTADLAADQSALAAGNEPLHLASALLKVGRLRGPAATNFSITGSHLLPGQFGPRMETRVTSLVALAGGGAHIRVRQFPRRMVYGGVLATAILFAVCYAAAAHVVLPLVEDALDILF